MLKQSGSLGHPSRKERLQQQSYLTCWPWIFYAWKCNSANTSRRSYHWRGWKGAGTGKNIICPAVPINQKGYILHLSNQSYLVTSWVVFPVQAGHFKQTGPSATPAVNHESNLVYLAFVRSVISSHLMGCLFHASRPFQAVRDKCKSLPNWTK